MIVWVQLKHLLPSIFSSSGVHSHQAAELHIIWSSGLIIDSGSSGCIQSFYVQPPTVQTSLSHIPDLNNHGFKCNVCKDLVISIFCMKENYQIFFFTYGPLKELKELLGCHIGWQALMRFVTVVTNWDS